MVGRGTISNDLRLARRRSQFRRFRLAPDIPVSLSLRLYACVALSKQDLRRLSSNEGVWAFVDSSQGYAHGRRLIKFERDVCYVVEPGKNIFEVKPKKLERTDAVTLVAETGFWNYGRFSMRFDSEADADAIEQRLRPRVPKRH